MPIKDMAKIFKTLGDPTRLRIVLLLLRQKLCVCEMMLLLDAGQSLVSHHLRILRDAGIAEDIREGRWIFYQVPEASRPLLEGLLAGEIGERLEVSGQVSEDARTIKTFRRNNPRGRSRKGGVARAVRRPAGRHAGGNSLG